MLQTECLPASFLSCPAARKLQAVPPGRVLLCIPAVIALLVASALPAFAADAIGQIKTEAGPVMIERGKTHVPAHVGDRVYESDTLVTGKNGSVGVTFEDNSMMSLGPNSKLALDAFRFDTTTPEGQFNASLKSGTL